MKIDEFKHKLEASVNHLKSELSTIRTGRATASLVEEIKVDAYDGSPAMALKELATISLPDAATINVRPWDLSLIPKIEKAIRNAPGGLNAVTFDDTLRVPLPPLSEERRKELTKVVHAKVEEAKITIRQIRQDEMRSLDEMEQNGVISQDDRFRQRAEVEKIVKEKTHEVEAIGRSKEQELLRI